MIIKIDFAFAIWLAFQFETFSSDKNIQNFSNHSLANITQEHDNLLFASRIYQPEKYHSIW